MSAEGIAQAQFTQVEDRLPTQRSNVSPSDLRVERDPVGVSERLEHRNSRMPALDFASSRRASMVDQRWADYMEAVVTPQQRHHRDEQEATVKLAAGGLNAAAMQFW